MTRRHVLHVFTTFAPGGLEVRAAQLMGRWQNVRHSIVVRDGRTECAERIAPHVERRFVPAPRSRGSVANVWSMARLLRSERPDLVLTYNWGTIETVLAARFVRGLRLVHHEDGVHADEALRPLRRRTWTRRIALRAANAVVVPSLALQQSALSAWRVRPDRVHHLPNGVDVARFTPARREPDGTFVIGTVGGLRPEKDQSLLLEAVSRMPERDAIRVVLVGEGPERVSLEARAIELGIAQIVTFVGAVADPAPWYRRFDVFVLSSRTEQMPLSILEAMASGLPIVSTDVGDVGRMISIDARRLLVSRRDPDAFARSLTTLRNDDPLRHSLAADHRQIAETRYDLDTCLDRFLAVYELAMAASV